MCLARNILPTNHAPDGKCERESERKVRGGSLLLDGGRTFLRFDQRATLGVFDVGGSGTGHGIITAAGEPEAAAAAQHEEFTVVLKLGFFEKAETTQF